MWIILSKIVVAAERVGISSTLLVSLCHTETRIRNIDNLKDGGTPSYGVCQVKLATAREFFPKITVEELRKPYVNAYVAATYLKHQTKRFGSVLKGISAYNAGRPIRGNRDYVNKVLTKLKEINESSRNTLLVYK